jgi:hypothetical protein
MKTTFPYCDQSDCKHYENCQSESSILVRILKQNPELIQLHNSCRNMMQKNWDNHMLEITGTWLNKRNTK